MVAAPTAGTCSPWITGDDLPTTCCTDPDIRDTAAVISSNILYRLSGRQYPGICERTVRPCTAGCAVPRWPAYRDHWWLAEQTATGSWSYPAVHYWRGGTCVDRCRLPTVVLPGPVVSITQIVADGTILDPGAYRVTGYRNLNRIDGGHWPCTQRLDLNSGIGGAPGTWQVTYQYGRLPDAGGIQAAQMYGCEIAKALCPADATTGECKLPERTRTVVREGITFDIVASLDFLDNGKTGLGFVDAWLASVNPARLQRRATIRRLDT